MFKTIFAKQFVCYFSALIISFVILAVALFAAFGDYFVSQKCKVLTEQARRIATIYRPNIFGTLTFNQRQLENEISVLHEYLNSSFIFVNENHVILMVTSDIASQSGRTLDLPEFNPVFQGETVTTIGNVGGIFSETVLTVAYPVVANGNVVGAVLLSSSMPELKRSSSEMFRTTLLCLFASGVIAFVLVFLFSRSISRPLREMSEAASVIAGGDFEKRLNVHGQDEVGQLAQSFNHMAESLFQQEKQRRIFIANISHDLRSPLTSIRGFLHAILDGTIPPEKQTHYLNIIMEETQRLSKLTHDIIDLDKIQSQDDLTLNMTSFDVNVLIRKIAQMFVEEAKRKNMAVSLKLAAEKTFVMADEEKIQRVLFNLVDNAVKFTQQDGLVEIETTVKDKKVLIAVKDNGPGILPEEQLQIFERFYKADVSRGLDKKGSGLGLSIVKAFVKGHGEEMKLTSKEGEGSVFTFALSLAPSNPNHEK